MEPLEIDTIINDLGAQQHALNQQIHRTPTGTIRAELCDANIHLTMALLNLRRVRDAQHIAELNLPQVQA